MSLELANYEDRAREAVKAAMVRLVASGNWDAGARGGVTAGKNMEGFPNLVRDLVSANGVVMAEVWVQQRVLSCLERSY